MYTGLKKKIESKLLDRLKKWHPDRHQQVKIIAAQKGMFLNEAIRDMADDWIMKNIPKKKRNEDSCAK